jgi:hypothetical protein
MKPSKLLLDTSAQARAGAGYDKAAFAVDCRDTAPVSRADPGETPTFQDQ